LAEGEDHRASITGPEERQKLYREFSPGFFDLIVIDECHRGSAAEGSAWRDVLEFFSAATQIGLTATPKETRYVSNTKYFGPPVYSYSLKQGIRDGFLAPYKVVKVHIDRDVEGYRPEKGREHAAREGKQQLSNFIDPESPYPVLVTTSRLLSTGADVQTCRLIALDREVGSMTEFKQIVGRGTRVHEDTRKFYFTLIDFRAATNHFADPEFDGEPVQIHEPREDEPITPPDDAPSTGDEGETLPDQPGADEVVVGRPGRYHAAGDRGWCEKEDLCGRRRGRDRRRTRRISRRERGCAEPG
jgi:type I site-specific restriction endonuclease